MTSIADADLLTKEIFVSGQAVTLYSRDGKTWMMQKTSLAPEGANESLPKPSLLDEIIKVTPEPKPAAEKPLRKKNYNRLYFWARLLSEIVSIRGSAGSFTEENAELHTGQLILATFEFGWDVEKLAQITGFPRKWIEGRLDTGRKARVIQDNKWCTDDTSDLDDPTVMTVQMSLWILALEGTVVLLPAKASS